MRLILLIFPLLAYSISDWLIDTLRNQRDLAASLPLAKATIAGSYFPSSIYTTQRIIYTLVWTGSQYTFSPNTTLFPGPLQNYLASTASIWEADVRTLIFNIEDSPANVNNTAPGTLRRLLAPIYGYVYTPSMLLQQHGTNSTDTLTSQDVIEAPIDVGSLNIFEDHLDLLSNSESLAQYTVTPASSRRLLIGLGAYPTNYNTSLDSDYIFTSAQLYSMHGQNYSECLLSQKAAANFSICESCTALYSNGSVSSHDVSKVTRPYPFLADLGASAVNPSAAVFDGPQTALTIQCGLNPMYTNNVTNDDLNSLPWSWDNAMPVNGSLDCAVMSSAAAGRWRVSDCNRVLSIACQSNSNPLQWFISPAAVAFANGDTACPSGYAFGVPRSAQQNSALRTAAVLANGNNFADVALNYNDITISGCWVVGGDTCPYYDVSRAFASFIKVSTITGTIIALLLAGGVYLSYRRHLRHRKLMKRKSDVRQKLKKSDFVSIPQ